MNGKRQYFRFVLCILLPVFLGGCLGGGATTPTRYYLIDPVTYPGVQADGAESLSIAIIDLHIPQYLERFHIATRSSSNRLQFSETNQWAESLRKNLLRTMARNLSEYLSTIDVGTPLNRSASEPDYSLQIHIEQFEQDINDKVKLSARWQVMRGAGYEALGTHSTSLESRETIEENNYDQMVSVMRDLFGELGSQIAGSILAQENRDSP